jgi:hypothetical protein
MKTFAELTPNQRLRAVQKLWLLGLHAEIVETPRQKRVQCASLALEWWIADWVIKWPKCRHAPYGCDETGHCTNCGKRWPTYEEGLPFP